MKFCRSHASIHVLMTGALVFAGLMPLAVYISEPVSATTYYYGTNEASSYNSTYWQVFPRYATGEVSLYAAQVREDGNSSDLYTSATITYVETNDFTNTEEWYQPSTPYVGGTQVDFMPPDNGTATVIYVYVCARVTTKFPSCYLSFSTDNESSWTTSSLIPEMTNSMYFWDVTDEIEWNATILNSSELWVKMKAYTTVGVHYYMDYLGISVMWSADYVVEGYGIPIVTEPDPLEDESALDLDYDFIFTDGGIIGVMGLIGFIGMIAVPAASIWVYRHSNEGRLSLFVKMVATFVLCFSLFMVALTGG